ncbi:MAG: hypothetical protein K6G27_07230 [Lachnospiraceae bacterium]|nr:hypothetical protein [Lachnospiraceae bacterium]
MKLFKNLKKFKIRENPKIQNTIKILKALKNFKEFDSVKNLKITKAFRGFKDKMAEFGSVLPQILLLSVPHVLVMFLVISAVIPADIAEGKTAYEGLLNEENLQDGAASVGAAVVGDTEYKSVGSETIAGNEEQVSFKNGNRISSADAVANARSGAFIPSDPYVSGNSVSGDYVALDPAFDLTGYSENIEANKRELARRIWSTMSSFKPIEGGSKGKTTYYGLRGEQICALLGNWEQESGLDPTAVEAVFYEPWALGYTKQEAVKRNFITEYYWGTDEMNGYFERHGNIYKAGIGLAQWTDTYSGTQIIGTEAGESRTINEDQDTARTGESESSSILADSEDNIVIMDNSEIDLIKGNDIRIDGTEGAVEESSHDAEAANDEKSARGTALHTKRTPGRNSKLTGYAAKKGLQFYNGINKGAAVWDCDKWILSEAPVKGSWCDPLVQLAFTLDTASGDSRAAWLNSWADHGEIYWKGDRTVDLGMLSDNALEGWTWAGKDAFTVEHGWNPSLFYVADDVVEFSTKTDTISPSGDNTEDITDFKATDTSLRKGVCNDDYYNTPNNDYIAGIMYDSWDWENGKALSTSGDAWDRSNTDEARQGTVNSARELAFEYAEKSAGLAWHGRLNDKHGVLGTDPEWNDYSRAAGHDFICENNASNIFILENGVEKDGPFQHYGVIEDNLIIDSYGNEVHDYKYGWIMDDDPTMVANDRARNQYRHLFKYIYRYHLYRYMTMYYTTQFLAEYEGVPGKALEERQRNALRWFQLWWDSGMTGKAEPNVYAPDAVSVNAFGEKESFFTIVPEYAQSIVENMK